MITITGQREIAGCSVFRDDTDALAFYVMPQSPRIATDENGRPIFSLVQYRRDVAQLSEEERRTRLGGGLLTLSVELSRTPEEDAQIRETLANDPKLHALLNFTRGRWWNEEIRQDKRKLAAALNVGTVPISEGTIGVAVLGETADAAGEFVARLIGAGKVSMTGRQRAAIMAKLTLDGAVLMMEMAKRKLASIRIGYDLAFQHRLDAVRMVVWCHAQKAYTSIQETFASLQDNASYSDKYSGNSSYHTFSHDESQDARNIISKVAQDSEASGVDIIQEGGGDTVTPEQIAELQKIGYDMIKDFLSATFLEWKPGEGDVQKEEPELQTQLPTAAGKEYGHHGIKYYHLKQWTENMSADLTFNLRQKAVVKGFLGPQDNLANLVGQYRFEDFVTQIDLDADWFKFLDVQIVCTADFEKDPIDLVTATLRYQARGPQGDIDTQKSFSFTKAAPSGQFATFLAAPDQRLYSYEYEVHYRGSTATMKGGGKDVAEILVLDTDRLGVVRVETQMGLVDWDQIRQVFVKLSYGAGSDLQETEFTLGQEKQSHEWIQAVGKVIDQPYTYEVTWVDKNNQRLAQPPGTSRSPQLVLNQPIGQSMEVVVSPAGTFGELLAQVVVALRYTDAVNNYVVDDVMTFNKSEPKIWKVPLRNPSLYNYEYRVSVFYSDGVTREDDWRKTDKAILAVGDPFGYRVQISPYLLKQPPGQWAFALIHLKYDDAAENIHAEKDLEINDFAKPLFWRFRTAAPDRHTYKYQVSLFKPDGSEVKLPEREETREVLVLTPPPPAPPPPA